MKKVSVFIKQNDLDNSLNQLRNLGLVHIMTPAGHNRKTERIQNEVFQLQKAMQIIDTYQSEKEKGEKKTKRKQKEIADTSISEEVNPYELSEKIVQLDNERQQNFETIKELKKGKTFFENIVKINPHDIEYLNRNGIYPYIYDIDKKYLPAFSDKKYTILSDNKKRLRLIIWASEDERKATEFEPIDIPEMSEEEIIEKLNSLYKKNETIFNEILANEHFTKNMSDEYERVLQSLHFEKVKSGLVDSEPVHWFVGFIPEEDFPVLKNEAKNMAWGLISDSPKIDEPVPTKLKNNKIISMIEPIFNILGTVPGYREYDISFLFLSFFSIFVAMIIGDAGYGVLFLAGSIFLHLKSKNLTKTNMLLYVLSLCTIFWGAITGTWFGSEMIASISFLNSLVIPEIASFPEIAGSTTNISQTNVIYICFIIGTIQLSIACLMNFFREFPHLKSYSQLGWLTLIIGLYFLVLTLVLEFTLPFWTIYAIIAGITLIVIFGEQKAGQPFLKGFIKGLGGLFTTFLDSISTFSNIISYIRLFAVGMASVAIASSFNDMANSMMGGFTIPLAIMILLIGHGLNIVMGLLSVFVHGVRLNMLEFSGQLGMEWTGFKYAPFKESDKQ
ncbi:MAG: ATPase [Spirochaetia bacterium]|nr:ATPase [Spirochaetia bacterium]